jgi:hypothetical protein
MLDKPSRHHDVSSQGESLSRGVNLQLGEAVDAAPRTHRRVATATVSTRIYVQLELCARCIPPPHSPVWSIACQSCSRSCGLRLWWCTGASG